MSNVQMKRQSSLTEPFNREIKKQRSKPCFASNDLITSIENLSNEIFYEIFDYLDGYDIYQVFFNLNNRFQQLVTSSSLKTKFCQQLSSEIENRCKNFVIPNRHRIISIKFCNLLTIDEFSKQCIIDSSFTRLESITFHKISSNKLMAFLFYLNSLPQLFSLTIYRDDDGDDDYYDLSEIYRMILQLHSLKYYFLALSEETELTKLVPFAINERFSTLEYLIMIHKSTPNQLISILYHTPRLRHLSCRELMESDENMNNEVLLTLPDLTWFRVGTCFIEFNEFERFMQKIGGQLKVLYNWIFPNANYIDPDRWKQLILQHIPHLLEFHVQCFINVDDHFKDTYFDSFLEQFNSRFWIDHGWVFGLVFQYGKIFYSIKSNRKLWCRLDENEDIITYSNQRSCHDLAPHIIRSTTQNIGKSSTQTIELSIWDRGYLAANISIIDKLNPMLSALQINSLYVCCYEIPISTFLTLIYLLPNLDSLNVRSLPLQELSKLSTEDTETLRLVSNSNKITKVWLPSEFEYAEFLIDLCPRIEYVTVTWMMETEVKKLVRFILLKTVTNIPHLHSLILDVHNEDDQMIHKLQKMIDFKKLRTDFTIKRSLDGIVLQLKSK